MPIQPFEQYKQPEDTESLPADGEPVAESELLHEEREALESDVFEEASEALEKVESLQEFRAKVSELPPFDSFYEAVEVITNINKIPASRQEKKERVAEAASAMRSRSGQMSPRVADLYQALLSEVDSEAYEPHFDITREYVSELKKAGDISTLFSGQVPWEIKANRVETRIAHYLAGIRALDNREGNEMDDDTREWREEELRKINESPANPPQRQNESSPGVDPMERLKDGEKVPAIWSISPAWGGYYKEQSFSVWDNERNVWRESEEYSYSDVDTVALSGNSDHENGPIDITMNARIVAGQWVTLPVPYTHGLHKIEAGGRKHRVQKDQNGDLVILIEGEEGGEVEIKAVLAPDSGKRFTTQDNEKVKVPDMNAEFSEETESKLEEIANRKKGNIARAKAINSYVMSRIRYLAPKDQAEAEHYNNIYRTSDKGFAGAVDEVKTGDCDVVNTYFSALCARLDIPTRHAIGHSVKGKDEEGFSSINSGTGHGWSEVWDEVKKEWVRMDATPPGDPNLEEEGEQEGEGAPGDYGEQEAFRASDEELEKLRERLSEHKEKLSYTKEERELAEGADIELREAREIVKEINEAERTTLPSGERVVDALSKLFNAIVESRKDTVSVYEGPVRKREGGEAIDDIVAHKVGILSGESDPLSREKPKEETKDEKLIGGFDLYVVGDKSGSMQSGFEGETLWEMQRRAEYLIFSSLHRFEKNLERVGLKKENALSVRTQAISFRGDKFEDLDVDKQLSSDFTAQDKVNMWHSLTQAGGGNGDIAALSYVYEQIKEEIEKNKDRSADDNRLRIVIACSDGGYVGAEAQMQAIAEELGKLDVVVVGMGLTESAAEVPEVMDNPPHSRGDIVRDINDLPVVVAKHVVSEAVKLFPEKGRDNAQLVIENALSKFKKT